MHVLLAPRKRGQKLLISLLIAVLMSCSLWRRGSDRLVMRRSVQIWHLRVSQWNHFSALHHSTEGLPPTSLLLDHLHSILSHIIWTHSCHTDFDTEDTPLLHALLPSIKLQEQADWLSLLWEISRPSRTLHLPGRWLLYPWRLQLPLQFSA